MFGNKIKKIKKILSSTLSAEIEIFKYLYKKKVFRYFYFEARDLGFGNQNKYNYHTVIWSETFPCVSKYAVLQITKTKHGNEFIGV